MMLLEIYLVNIYFDAIFSNGATSSSKETARCHWTNNNG